MSLGFPTTYIINLERAEDKRAHAEQNISKYTDRYEFFNAVDGRALNVAQIGQYYDAALNQKLGKRPLSKPEIGCYLSHIGVWTEIVARQDETALILEDDFDFQFDPREFFDEMNKLDLRRVIVKIDASRTRGVVRSRCEAGKFCLVANDIIGPRTTGYILGRDAAISLLVSNSRFFRPIDNDLKHLWEHTVPIFTALPAMVAEMKGAASVSALAHDRSMAKPADILARFVRNLRYQINFRRGRARNNSYQRPPDLTQGDSHERRDLIQWHQGKGGFDGSKDYAQRQVRRRASPGSGAVPGWESGATDVGDCPGSGWG